MQAPAAVSGRKRRATNVDDDPTRIDATPQLRALKEHLMCARHRGCFCYVMMPSGEHKEVDVFTLTLWARKMVKLYSFSGSQLTNKSFSRLQTRQLFGSLRTSCLSTVAQQRSHVQARPSKLPSKFITISLQLHPPHLLPTAGVITAPMPRLRLRTLTISVLITQRLLWLYTSSMTCCQTTCCSMSLVFAAMPCIRSTRSSSKMMIIFASTSGWRMR